MEISSAVRDSPLDDLDPDKDGLNFYIGNGYSMAIFL
jgi:hypothetical protein